MEITCGIIRDILPLYAENMVSDETRRMVDAHLCGCDGCTKLLAQMIKKPEILPEVETNSLIAVKETIRKRRWLMMLMTFFLTAAVAVGAFAYFTRPIYLTQEEAEVQIIEEGDRLIIDFGEKVDCYTVEAERFEGEDNLTFRITAYRRVWNIHYGNMLNAHVNVVGQDYPFDISTEAARIFYGEKSGEDTLLWGEPARDHVIFLPRLVLGYYILLALGAGTVLLGISWVMRKKKHHSSLLAAGALLLSFSASGMIFTGGNWRVHEAIDLPTYLILISILAGLIWAAWLCGWRLWKMARVDQCK